ncbi:LYR motif-containing protein 4A [Acipenser oxyrinchus oxyrinchus]|uniref:LYR motif-containing protein 4A n=1 Tax=Acipenser oxyrinchus oxyrinchus TaxID=40147 RepID=A0AAD8GFW1_ACIOX|nr:LYR motif-containing protein 4A [Acipenser oxyrinchus oxyrinchus]
MAASSRTQVLSLYRLMLKESKNFPAYNYRTYAIRRVRDAFRENKHVEDPKTIQALLVKARENLLLIQRQVRLFSIPTCMAALYLAALNQISGPISCLQTA